MRLTFAVVPERDQIEIVPPTADEWREAVMGTVEGSDGGSAE